MKKERILLLLLAFALLVFSSLSFQRTTTLYWF